ncbi:unnamed protein product [Rotaria sp. Silwood2]|nr:unnamed protein product [Rotaria sp. Silwood2]
MLSLVLVVTYTANLASDLTTIKSNYFISGIDNIINGKIPYSRIGIVTESSLEDFYLLDNNIDVAISDTAILEYITNKVYCNLTLVGADFSRSAYGIVIPKQWIYQKDLDVVILSLRESGVLDDLKRKWFKGSLCQQSFSSYTYISMNITAMSGLLFTFATISILSLALYAWTKRFIIKSFLCILTRGKDPSIQE